MGQSDMSDWDGSFRLPDDTDLTRFTRRMRAWQERMAPRVALYKPRRTFLAWLDFPFASVSVVVLLLSMFALSMYLGGWGWSSWTYAFALGLSIPLAAIELKRKAVITGGAALLLVFTVVIDAGLPQYFGYNPSDLSWYDLTAHYLGALLLTLFLWSLLWWTLSPSGPPRENGTRKFYAVVITMLMVSFTFEFAEAVTDLFFGWANFHPGVDTLGDIIFDFAGVLTAAILISRHRVTAFKRPFWHVEATRSPSA